MKPVKSVGNNDFQTVARLRLDGGRGDKTAGETAVSDTMGRDGCGRDWVVGMVLHTVGIVDEHRLAQRIQKVIMKGRITAPDITNVEHRHRASSGFRFREDADVLPSGRDQVAVLIELTEEGRKEASVYS